jgi:O-antigen/teichoic acid export membrane protein/glycosyltransferase involved in cell wall biosynthesis
LRGTAWTGASQLTGKLLFFLSTLLLARLLDQEDFGVAAYAITVTALVAAVPSLGLAPALIHYRDDEEILSTGFWLGLAAAVVVFLAVWMLAPLTEQFFGDPRAVGVTRALALLFPIEALRNVHAALLRRRLAFRLRFVPEFVQSLTKGGVAIAMAIAGFGAWSLIGGSLAGAAAGAVAYWRVTSWRPTWRFDLAAARKLLPFGGHVVTVDLLGAFVRNLDYLLVGRFLGATVLGVYVLAFRIPDLLIRNLSRTLGQVLLPVYATVKDDPEAIRDTFTASMSYLFALTAPLAVGMAILAEPLVSTLFSEKWLDVAPVIPPICLYALFISLSFNLGDLYKALGRPEVLSRISFARACLAAPQRRSRGLGTSLRGRRDHDSPLRGCAAGVRPASGSHPSGPRTRGRRDRSHGRRGFPRCSYELGATRLRAAAAGHLRRGGRLHRVASDLRPRVPRRWPRQASPGLLAGRNDRGEPRMSLHVAYLLSRFPKLSETFVVDEIRALERAGAHVSIYSLLPGRTAQAESDASDLAAKVVTAGPASLRWLAAQVYWLAHSPAALTGVWVRALRTHSGSLRELVRAFVAVAHGAWFARSMQRNGIETIHAHWATHTALAAWTVHRLTGLPYSFTTHADDIFVRRPMLEEKVRDARWVVTISDFNRRYLCEQLGSEAERKLRVVRCGVRTGEFVPLPQSVAEPFTVACVARLEPKKGHIHLLDACAELARRDVAFRCVIAGDGRERAALEQRVRDLALEGRVELLGSVSRSRVRRLLAECHAVALPCVVAEGGRADGIPVCLMEALAVGRPVVTTPVSGIPELVEHEKTGLLVAPADPIALADALVRLHTDPALCAQLTAEGRKRVTQEYDVDRNAAQLLSLFRAGTEQ